MGLTMNAEQRDELVRRLRSGEYEQGRQKLAVKSPEGEQYCCLGVLCEMAVEAGVIPRIEREVECLDCDAPDEPTFEIHYDSNASLLPYKVVVWAGIESTDIEERRSGDDYDYQDHESMGRFLADHDPAENTTLAAMNDSGVSFKEIANFIENEVVAR